ncbi:hypothetical protein [Photobacterium sp. OFAV2-7]|uniref:hypothetical protein n=1 Tax=Photobacterium sp. OFAV2-7 TaxID=2917748 RepID=UPI001EF5CC7B|nr:hypothetical protein [Photobacterium sp. OFAV2-7]MCG7587248.1 hypothetical protein [Photobacterium sp. OFAV2-7]
MIIEKISLLIVSFLLSGILGGFFGYHLKRRAWSEETKHALHQARYKEGVEFLDELSYLIANRFFLIQRLVWAIELDDHEKIREREKQYFEVVEKWNSCFWRNRNKIRLLVGEEQANYFLYYHDDNAGNKPKSLHYKFVIAHRSVIFAKENREAIPEAIRQVTELNWKCSVFLERLASEFLSRAIDIQLLKVPTDSGGAEQAHMAQDDRVI